jgi:hypothetical protein
LTRIDPILAWAFCAALALSVLWNAPVVAQSTAAEVELPPQAPKSSPITEVPLPTEPPVPPRSAPVEKRSPLPSVVEKPKAAAAPQKAEPAPVPVTAPKPRAECVIKPVMSDDDLRACGALR